MRYKCVRCLKPFDIERNTYLNPDIGEKLVVCPECGMTINRHFAWALLMTQKLDESEHMPKQEGFKAAEGVSDAQTIT